MSSTEESVTAFFVSSIQSISNAITVDAGNVHPYTLEYCHPEGYENYLLTTSQGSREVRAIGVLTTSTEEPHSEQGGLDSLVVTRTYQVRVRMYYGLGIKGEGISALIEDARAIRGEIYAAGANLKKLVHQFVGVQGPNIQLIDPLSSVEGRIITAEMVFTYRKIKPDF